MYSFSYTYDGSDDNTSPVLGEPITIHIVRDDNTESSSFTMEYSVYDYEGDTYIRGIVFEEHSGDSFIWTPPVEWAQYNTHSSKISVTLRMKLDSTGQNSGVIGSLVSNTLNFRVPDSVAPILSSTVTDGAGCITRYGVGIQGKTYLNVSFSATGVHNAKIYSVSATLNGKVLLQEENNPSGLFSFTTDVISEPGEVLLILSATDSRGLTTTEETIIEFAPYENVRIVNVSVTRCDEDGTHNSKGSYASIEFSVNVHSINDKNTSAYEIKYKKRSDSEYTTVLLDGLSNVYIVDNQSFIFEADLASSYDVILTVTDQFSTNEKHIILTSGSKLWSALKNGLGFAFGKVAERIGFLDMGFGIYMNKNKIVDLAEPSDESDAATKKYVDQESAKILSGAAQQTKDSLAAYSCLSDPIWENEDASASFPMQNITIPLSDDVSNYKAILLSVRQGFLLDGDCRSYYVVPVGGSFNILAYPGSEITVDSKTVMIDWGTRKCSINADGTVSFDQVRLVSQSTAYVFNNYLVPDKIYGIR